MNNFGNEICDILFGGERFFKRRAVLFDNLNDLGEIDSRIVMIQSEGLKDGNIGNRTVLNIVNMKVQLFCIIGILNEANVDVTHDDFIDNFRF
jgi:hypothetical protein